jgi:tetratricopeptide (TPR) repeat protein
MLKRYYCRAKLMRGNWIGVSTLPGRSSKYCLVFFCWVIVFLLLRAYCHEAISRLHYLSANNENPLVSADEAVALNPDDPNAHFIRAGVLLDHGELSRAIRELESAVELRPQDFSLWLMLGDWRLKNDDTEAARTAYLNAIYLAPHYAKPHKALGNLYRTQGRFEEAFTEFRAAVAANPALFREIVDVALKTYQNDSAAVRRAIQPQTPSAYMVLANAFFDNGAVAEAVSLFQSAGVVDATARRGFITRLLNAKRFNEAFTVWSAWPSEGDMVRKYPGAVTNPGFENSIDLEDVGFDWRIAGDLKNVRVKLDGENPFSGVSSLRLEFNGNSSTSSPIVYQLVLVEAKAKYRVSFAVRTKDLVTGARPFVTVTDASNNKLLAQSVPLPEGTSRWQKFTIDCPTSEQTSAVIVAIQRKGSDSTVYPIFGRMWVDDVVLEKQ